MFYDNYDLAKCDKTSLRRMIGTCLQGGSLFAGDIFSNITVTAPNSTIDDAWRAAEMAGIADDIREMPMQMHTRMEERLAERPKSMGAVVEYCPCKLLKTPDTKCPCKDFREGRGCDCG